jgi:multidrug efflux pump subunit AcrA (membrane-fusion protein)
MPTTNPRVAVTLPPSLDLLVGRMARLQRISKSAVLRELLEAAEPALARACALMEAATKSVNAVKTGLADHLAATQDEAEKTLGSLLRQMDTATADLVRQAESIEERRPTRMRPTRRASAAGAKRPNPPSSNRGVKSGKSVTGRRP